jgi:hypothetical protein
MDMFVMQKFNIKPSVVALVSLLVLSACGGGGGDASSSSGVTPKPNAAPTINATPTLLNLESGGVAKVAVSASDDDGAPVVSISNNTANLTAELSSDGKMLTVTARTVTANEKGSVSLVATENNAAKKQATQQIEVNLFPKIDLYALVNGTRQQGTLTVEYAKPLNFRVVDENNSDIPFSAVVVKDSSVLKVQYSASNVILTALKSGTTTIEISGTTGSGLSYIKTFEVKTIGNQQPTLTLSPSSLTLQETTFAQVAVTIADPDGSAFQLGVFSVASSDVSLATASIKDGNLIINGLKSGTATITVSLVDGEFTVSSSVMVTITPETLPVLSINQNARIELEETDSIAIPIDIVGPKASEYKPSVQIDSVNGNLSDISYSVIGNTLNITAAELKNIGSADKVSFKVNAVATNGRNTLTAPSVALDVLVKTNGSPIFELPHKVGRNVMVKKDGVSTITIQVNDDNAKKVVLSNPEAWINESKAGTYTVTYDDVSRQLTLTLTGFERNEIFGILMSHRDGNWGGKFSIRFRTYELTALDLEVLDVRKETIAQIEAIKSYQLIAKMYAEYLETIGVVDAQYVDEIYDQMNHDDTEFFRLNSTEYYVQNFQEQVYNNDVNNGTLVLATVKATFEGLLKDAHQLNKKSIATINEMAAKSNGYFPPLSFENTAQEVAPLQFSKFYGKEAYGSMVNGRWEYAPAFRFLSAIDAKVAENTVKRLQ